MKAFGQVLTNQSKAKEPNAVRRLICEASVRATANWPKGLDSRDWFWGMCLDPNFAIKKKTQSLP